MKKFSGLLMLLVVAFLVSMPVAADVYEAPNSLNMLVTAADETKIVLQEEVVGNPGETLAVQSVEPCIPVGASVNMETTYRFDRRTNYCFTADVLLGGGRARPGYT